MQLISAFVCALLTTATAPSEGRGVWCYPNHLPHGNWESSAEFLADNGVNMMFPLMLSGGSAHYASDVLPRSEFFQKHGDQLEQCCTAAKKHGLEVHVWKVNFKLGKAPKSFIEKMRREGRTQVNVRGKPFDWLCPSHPENRKLELEAMLEVARKYPVDGLHFDYIRYPGRKLCYCDGCRRRFEADSGQPVADWPEDCYSGSRKKGYNDWRCRQITALVEEVSREARKVRPGINISAAVFGAYPDCRDSRAQDWPKWIEAGYLDFVCPMNYTNNNKDFAHWTRNQVKLISGRVPLYAGIGATSSKSKLSADEVLSQINLARSLGASGFVIFRLGETTAKTIIPELGKKLNEKKDKVAASLLPNGNFTAGGDSPDGWTLSGGSGRWVDNDLLEVTGTGDDSNEWRCKIQFTPGAIYRYEMSARGDSGSRAIAGPSFANRDYPLSEEWRQYSHVFRVPDNINEGVVRVGQWHKKSTNQFDSVRLSPVVPVHKSIGKIRLGEAEAITDGCYCFNAVFSHEGSNYHRPLESMTTTCNTNRLVFSGDRQATYRFSLPGHSFRSGKMGLFLCNHQRGACVAEVSRDRKIWLPLISHKEEGYAVADLPADMFPAESLWLRLRPDTKQSVFQIYIVEFTGELSGTPPEGTGQTVFARIENSSDELVIKETTLGDSRGQRRAAVLVTVKNRGPKAVRASLTGNVSQPELNVITNELPVQSVSLAPGQTHMFDVEVPFSHHGAHDVYLSIADGKGGAVSERLTLVMPEYYRSDYGQRIKGVQGNADVWWCEADWKISPQHPTPQAESSSATLSAARNDREAVQVVIRPKQDLHGLTAEVGALAGPDGATIPAKNIKLSRVYYHNVHTTTDTTGVRDRWPDALPPLDKPLDVPLGENQPLWVLVHVPKDARPGDYSGKVTLKAEGWSAVVPLRLHVWNFTLPERNHLETAIGLHPEYIYRYHRLKTDADKRRVWEMYLRIFAEHRISPYDLTPLDPIRVKFLPKADPPRAEVDFTAFDAEMTRVLKKYPFTNFRLPITGIGSGSCHRRMEGDIEGFGEKTSQYQAMFASYIKQLNDHLCDKGWAKMTYIYWFDEPRPVDYDFVRSGMERLKKSGPDLRTMLTEQPEDALAGAIDIWCPVSYAYRQKAAERRKAAGERFWWYVCCGPKEPFCTLFIDHPATELRTWLWQTWQRDISGTLIWAANYWTPRDDFLQNPYEDPMAYSHGSQPKDRRFWGNGDGRFIYPPLAVFDKALGDRPVIAPPVSSIRWEMIREGVEDYEFLWMLRELIAKRRGSLSSDELKQYESLLVVPEEITRDMTTFTTDPAPIHARRKAVAEAIEQLTE